MTDAGQTRVGGRRGNGPSGRRRAILVTGVALALLAVYAVPRLWALHGVSRTTFIASMDTYYHLVKVDMQVKRWTMLEELSRDPYIARNPQRLDPYQNARWTMGVIRLGALFSVMFGPQSIWTTQLTNLVFSAILVVAVLGLGRMVGSVRIGAWSAVLVLLCPGLVASTWYFSLDYPLVGVVLIGLVLIWWTAGFSRPRACLALALWSGLGMHVKTTYALYLVAPALLALITGVRDQRPRWRPALHALLAATLALVLVFALNGWHARSAIGELFAHFGRMEGMPFELLEPWTPRWAAAYAMFALAVFPWPLLVLSLPGLVLAHTRAARALGPARPLILSFLWSSYVLLTLLTNKMERYVQVLYPLLCLLTVWSIFTLVPRRWRSVAMVWCVTIYVSVLWLTHVRPTPWFLDRRSASTDAYMYEIRMPGARTLDGLRRNVDHPRCRLGPLVRRMDALAQQVAPRRPVGLAVVWGEAEPRLPFTSADLHLSAVQRVPRRLFIVKDAANHAPLPPDLLQLPALAVLHPRGLSLDRDPSLRVLRRHEDVLRCDGRPLPVALSIAVTR